MWKSLLYLPGLKNIQPIVFCWRATSTQDLNLRTVNKSCRLPSHSQTETTSSTCRCHHLPSLNPNKSAFSAAFLAASARGNNSPGSSEAKVAPAMDALSRCYIPSLPQPYGGGDMVGMSLLGTFPIMYIYIYIIVIVGTRSSSSSGIVVVVV